MVKDSFFFTFSPILFVPTTQRKRSQRDSNGWILQSTIAVTTKDLLCDVTLLFDIMYVLQTSH